MEGEVIQKMVGTEYVEERIYRICLKHQFLKEVGNDMVLLHPKQYILRDKRMYHAFFCMFSISIKN